MFETTIPFSCNIFCLKCVKQKSNQSLFYNPKKILHDTKQIRYIRNIKKKKV